MCLRRDRSEKDYDVDGSYRDQKQGKFTAFGKCQMKTSFRKVIAQKSGGKQHRAQKKTDVWHSREGRLPMHDQFEKIPVQHTQKPRQTRRTEKLPRDAQSRRNPPCRGEALPRGKEACYRPTDIGSP